MALTIGTLTISDLTAQPFAYDSEGSRGGLTYRIWNIEGLLRTADWVSLLGIYETWRNARKAEPDTMVSLSVGTTVAFSGSHRGQTWTNVACWFDDPPSGTVAGSYIKASFKLVDATQALTIMLRGQEIATQVADANTPSHGTITLGTTTLTLIDQPDGYLSGPTLERTAAGGLVVKGPLGAVPIKRVKGYTTEAGWTAIKGWYETALLATPTAGSYYPISEPTMERELIISGGARVNRCIVSVDVFQP